MGDNPSYHKGDELPIENVSWEEVKEFIKIKNNIDKDGYKYRLPSEAEWEYACCVGTTTLYFFGELCLDLDYYACYSGIKNMKAWYACGKICSHTIRVGQKLPNLWGLYDMYGNVSEWVQDIAHPDYRGAPVDGSPREESDEIEGWRIARGGSWYDPADTCNSRCRHSYLQNMKSPYVGFRLVRFKEEDQII
jgi:formylglycine-generating enzyme required for sulfatase activity